MMGKKPCFTYAPCTYYSTKNSSPTFQNTTLYTTTIAHELLVIQASPGRRVRPRRSRPSAAPPPILSAVRYRNPRSPVAPTRLALAARAAHLLVRGLHRSDRDRSCSGA